MAGNSIRELVVVLDRNALEKLQEEGTVAVRHPGDMEQIRIEYRDEDLEEAMEEFDNPGVI